MILVPYDARPVERAPGLIAVVSWPMILKKTSIPLDTALEMAVLWKVQL